MPLIPGDICCKSILSHFTHPEYISLAANQNENDSTIMDEHYASIYLDRKFKYCFKVHLNPVVLWILVTGT
jgi:hypothetical protein